MKLTDFQEIWLVDFEFRAPDGERPEVRCMVAREYHTGKTHRAWADKLHRMREPPFRTDEDALFVAYFASAELSCFRQLGWAMPKRILDLYVEFRKATNGLYPPSGNSLLGALVYYDQPGIESLEKETLRQLAMREGPSSAYTTEERESLIDYCESDVLALARLLPCMGPTLDLPRATLRGRYMAAVSAMEHTGTPIDTATLGVLKTRWHDIQEALIEEINREYDVFDGRVFKYDKFANWLERSGLPWPRLDSGQLAMDDDTFKQMARRFKEVAPLRELRHSLGEMRLFKDLAVGSDGRNRCLLGPFRSRTGRNQPSNAKFIFGPSAWLRGLIKPEPGKALAYVDWARQEFGIAGVLSGDSNMVEAYQSGDPYLTFAKQAGAVPPDATEDTHPDERAQFKVCALAVQYGMGSRGLAQQLDTQESKAKHLIRLHQDTYPKFWRWSTAAVDHAMAKGWVQTVYGWRIHVDLESNPRSLGNFPVQANGAEMMRLGCCRATEAGIDVNCPVHDALMVEGPADDIESVVDQTQSHMRAASRLVLDGFELQSDVKLVCYPQRYVDKKRGLKMWNTVMGLIGRPESLIQVE